MKSMFHAAALAALAVSLALPGCKKDDKKKDDAPAADMKSADPTTADVPAQPATGAPAGDTPTAMADPGMPPATGAPSGDPGVRPASVTDAHVATADKVVVTMNKFAGDLDAAKADCKKATGVVKSAKGDIEKVMNEAESMKGTLDTDQAAKDWFEKNYAPKMMGAIQKMGGVAQTCGSDKDFMAAMQDLNMNGKKKDGATPAK